ncbi:MAG: GNAT family N-acetyltransferase [Anaerolineae bacterium]
MMGQAYHKDDFTISTDPALLDIEVIHGYLVRSYWSRGIPQELAQKSIQNSLCFGLYHQSRQIGFARIITDYANLAYLCDVFVLEAYQGQGLGKWLVECILAHLAPHNIRRFMLATTDAHELYRKFGFGELSAPEFFMEKLYERTWFKPE